MIPFLLIAALQVAPQVDTVTQTTILPRAQIVVNGDSTWIDLRVDITADSVATVLRDYLALDARDAAQRACGQCGSGTPGWVYGGGLLVSAAFVLAYWRKESTEIVVTNTNTQDQTQEQSTTVTTHTTVRRGWWKKGKPHGHDDEEF